MEGPAPLGSAALDDPPDNDLVPLVPHGGAKRLIVLGDLDHSGVSGHTPSVPGGTITLTPRLILGPHLCQTLLPGQAALQAGKLVVRVEEALELDLVEQIQDLGGLGEMTLLQREHALKKTNGQFIYLMTSWETSYDKMN